MLLASLVVLLGAAVAQAEVLQNGGFESKSNWDCWSFQCDLVSDKHSGQHAMKSSGRSQSYQGPSQFVHVTAGHSYLVGAWVKVLGNGNSQNIEIMLDLHFTDDTHDYASLASHSHVTTSDGWFHLQGTTSIPTKALKEVRVYFQSGPSKDIDFLVDDATMTDMGAATHVTPAQLNKVIDQQRKSNINFHVTTANGINKSDVKIHVVQTKKSFPFGTAVNCYQYNQNAAGGKYRDFIHKHFNWAVTENCLKWPQIERNRGQKDYQTALDCIHGLRSHGIKVRGHNLVWSVPNNVQGWVKQLHGDALRHAVEDHINETMSKTRGLLEQWDVNNENLHGQFYQDALHDQDYDLEIFRIAHRADPSMTLFLNDYSVVAGGGSTNDYLMQGKRFKAAGSSVSVGGMGVQCHFGHEPNPGIIKERLDLLSQANLPIFATELDVMSQDENVRADYYETALRSLYGHPAIDGILMWGFWDQAHWRGEKAALVKGNDLQLTAAGRRVLDLYENQWMTDETHVLSGSQFTVRGFHGNYDVHVMYQGRELSSLKQSFTLSKGADKTININVHT